jgi:hypothetical protein
MVGVHFDKEELCNKGNFPVEDLKFLYRPFLITKREESSLLKQNGKYWYYRYHLVDERRSVNPSNSRNYILID